MPKAEQALYGTWAMMICRCTSPGAVAYENYGKRGIKVCDRWMNSFDAFRDDMGERPAGYTLDRIDVNGNYEPSNCRWASSAEQARNKRNSRFVEVNGKMKHLSDLSAESGIDARTLSYRLAQGWPMERVLNPARQYNNKASQAKAAKAHAEKKKTQKRCKRGHLLKGKNLYLNKGRRHCRTCRAMHERGEI